MKKIVLTALLLPLAALGHAFKTIRAVRYSDASAACVLDLKVPEGTQGFATVVNLHGGGLTDGQRHFAPWPAEAKDRDAVGFVAVRYRFLAEKDAAGKRMPGARPEEVISDAAAAVAWTLDHIAAYGGDPKKVFVTGISAGGYLTAMVGLDARWLAQFGHKPGDLAGIAPLTGQMTKHFNVRKIGFADRDPQYQPKIDAWAPLAYAGGKDLPPACFLTGGRDVEWPCRVEENELLAVSLRKCGHARTEFHETEGDHGGGVRASAYYLRDFVLRTCDADGVARFAPGERVVFYGDSITHGGKYVYYLLLFQDLRHPGSGVRLLNGGRSGGSAASGCNRFDRDLLPMKPDRAFVMFGMNDVGRDNWKSAAPSPAEAAARARSLESFKKHTVALADRFARAGVKTVMVTPSPFDQYGVFAKENIPFCNEPGLASCAAFVRALAAERHLGVVDFHAPLTQLFKDHARDYHFCADRVHPGNEGHLIMAALVLDAMHVSPTVARVALDGATGRAAPVGRPGGTVNAVVRACRTTPTGLAFTYAPKALPLPKMPEYEKDLAFYPLTEKLNQEIFQVSGLQPGRYALAFDGRRVGTFTEADFAAGVNVALLDTPNQRRAQEIVAPMRTLQAVNSGLRNVLLVKYMLQDAHVDAADRAAADAYLDTWLAQQRKSPWYGGLKAWVDGYRAGRDREAAVRAQIEDLYEQMGAVRPAVSRVTLVRVP